MIRRIYNKINDLSIRHKLLIVFLGLVTVPICLLLIINLYVSTRNSEQQAKYTMNQVMNQTKSNIEFKTESVSNLINIITQNATLQDLVQKQKRYYDENIGSWMLDDQNLTKALYFTFENPNISSMHFYMKEGLASAAATDEYMQLGSAVISSNWYKQLVKNDFELSWYKSSDIEPGKNGGTDFISAVKGVPSSLNLTDFFGIVRLDVPINLIKTTLDESLFTKSSSAFLINSGNEVLCSSGSLSEADFMSMIEALSQNNSTTSENDWQTVKFDQRDYLIESRGIEFTDWKVILIVPNSDFLALNISSRNQMMLIYLIVAPLTLPLSFLLSNSATKRIRKLIANMKKAEHGNFNVSVLPSNNDEIGQLIHSFSYMLTRMGALMDDKFKLGREMKNLEMKALQAQINPHFLYNTLDLMNWMSVRNNAPDIGVLAVALGKFYRLSLSHGEDIVTIGNEVDHVKSYVQIQNMRFENNIILENNIPDDMLRYSLVKLVLQPIVENAILHGILEKDDEAGTICIACTTDGKTIWITVRDDGVGISDERIHEILSAESTNEFHGYGVHNINERLKLYYGNEYGLSYESEIGYYTLATITIPAIIYTEDIKKFAFM